MIHNMEDGRKKQRQYGSDGPQGYLSEEELMELIGHVESHEMLHAPKQLKGNIFAQIRQERRAARKRQVFVYRAKVLIAMAAALAVLIMMPGQGTSSRQDVPAQQQEETESLEQMALRRQKNRDSDWKKYLEDQERGGIRGFFEDINQRMGQFGKKLYYDITT